MEGKILEFKGETEMKMKYLMLGVSCLALCASTAWAATTAPAGAVVGWWKFDDVANPGKDSSEYGNDLQMDGSKVFVVNSDSGYKTRGYYNNSGCLHIDSAGAQAKTSDVKALWDTTKGYTYLARVRSNVSVDVPSSIFADSQLISLCEMLNDKESWHVLSYRFDPNKTSIGTNYKYALFGDDAYANASSVSSDSVSTFLITSGIAIGGTVKFASGLVSRSLSFSGYVDDAVVVARTMAKQEIRQFLNTGDPNPYLMADNDVSFASTTGWSCNQDGFTYAPANLPGADFQVDNGRTIKALAAHANTSFGGHSLILGRTSPLISVADLSTVVATRDGNFVQAVSVTIPDLRLNCGKIIASAGTTLTATKLTVNATAENPFEVNVDSGDYAISGAAAGTGSLLKTGAGTLDLRGLTGAAKVVVSGGKVLANSNVTVVYAEDEGAVPVLMVE